MKDLPPDNSVSTSNRKTGGCSVLMFLILLVIAAGISAVALRRSPPDAPNPSATATPQEVPQP